MKVWIVNPFDNLPHEGCRAQRYWLMARAFAAAGDAVTLWTSDFSHSRKARRELVKTVDEPGVELRMVSTPSYRGNISLRRVWSHRMLARRWARLAEAESAAPDLVIASSPPLGLCAAARRYCARRGIRFVVDVMDAWPETFERVLPRFLLAPLRRVARANYLGASVITVVAERYAELVKAYGAKVPVRLFYHGIERGSRVPVRPSVYTLVYVGNMSASYDLATLIEAVKGMEGVRLELAGKGPDEPRLRQLAADSPRICFHGYLGEEAMGELLARSSAGVVPMFAASCVGVPYKLADYAAAGLPILNTLAGETAALIEREGAGVNCEPGDVAAMRAAIAALRTKDPAALSSGASRLAELFDASRIYADYAHFLHAE